MAKYSPLSGESIYDVAVKLYGDMALGVKVLLAMNAIALNSDLSGQELTYDDSATRDIERQMVAPERPETLTYVAKEGETVYDIAVRLYGNSTLGIGRILQDNAITLSEDLTGKEIIYQDGIVYLAPQINVPIQREVSLTYSVLEGESIFDVASKLYGDLALGVQELLSKNQVSTIDNIPATFSYSVVEPRLKKTIPVPIPVRPKPFVTASNQSLYDLSITLHGSLDGLADLMENNPVSLDSAFPVGTIISYTPGNETSMKPQTDIILGPQEWIREAIEDTDARDFVSANYSTLVSISESLSASDLSTVIEALLNYMVEAITATESASATYSTTQSRTESATASDASDRAIIATGTENEALSASHSQDRTYIGLGTQSEALSSTDTPAGNIVTTKSQSEPLTAGHSQDRAYTGVGAQSESATATESESTTMVAPVSRTEPLAATDTTAGNIVTTQSQTESASATDSQNGGSAFVGSQSESITATESQNRTYTGLGTASEAASAGHSQDRTYVGLGSQTEAPTASDSQSGAMVATKSQTETATASESESGNLVTTQSRTEAATATESQTGGLSTTVSQSESATAGHSQDRTYTGLGTESEAATASHSQNRTYVGLGTENESITAGHSQDRTYVGLGTESESATASHSQDTQNNTFNNSRTEAATATDSPSSTKVTSADGSSAVHPNAQSSQGSTWSGLKSYTEISGFETFPNATIGRNVSITEAITATHSQDRGLTMSVTRTESASPTESSNATITSPLSVSLDTTNADASGSSSGDMYQQTNSVTGTPSGGTSPYTYLWELVSGAGNFTCDNSTSATTTWSWNAVPCGNTTYTETWRLKVTDNNSQVVYSDNVTVTMVNIETTCI